jgi:5'-3' exonuclease
LRKKWEDEGKAAPAPKKRWDHNAITPGTEFMHRLSKGIQYYINKRITYEPAWSNVSFGFNF